MMVKHSVQLISDMLLGSLGNIFSAIRMLLILSICWWSFSAVSGAITSASDQSLRAKSVADIQRISPKAANSRITLSKYLSILSHNSVFGNERMRSPSRTVTESNNENLLALLKDYQVQGTVLGDKPKVLLLDKKDNKVITLGVGEMIGPITVEAIYRDNVTFKLFEETIDVKF